MFFALLVGFCLADAIISFADIRSIYSTEFFLVMALIGLVLGLLRFYRVDFTPRTSQILDRVPPTIYRVLGLLTLAAGIPTLLLLMIIFAKAAFAAWISGVDATEFTLFTVAVEIVLVDYLLTLWPYFVSEVRRDSSCAD